MMNETQELSLNDIKIAFSEDHMWLMNLCLAIIMFSVATSINVKDFKEILKNPKGALAGVSSQFILFPLITFLLVILLKPEKGLALGMILIGACPGGNVSNFFSLQSNGNVALSVSLTIVATIIAPIMTPLNFEIWGSQVTYAQEYFNTFEISYSKLAKTVFVIMVIPLFVGMFLNYKFPTITSRISKALQGLSVIILIAFIAFALLGNLEVFKEHWHHVVWLVLLHNAVALAAGLYYGKLITGSLRDAKTISIETGIQNGGLGLVIVFSFFGGQGGMALLVAWWGIWDIFSGLMIAQIYKRWTERKVNLSM